MAVQDINYVFDKLANLSNLTKEPTSKNKNMHNEKWFDSECRNIWSLIKFWQIKEQISSPKVDE